MIQESHPCQGRHVGVGQAVGQRQSGLTRDGLFTRQLLPLQGTVRSRRRSRSAGNPSPPRPLLKNRVDPHIEATVVDRALELPAYDQIRVANQVLKRHALKVSPQGVLSIWLRHDLETINKRLKALEGKSAQEGLVLTESQLAALVRAKLGKKAHGELIGMSRLLRGAKHVLRRHAQGRGSRLPANLHRHLLEGCLRQALRPQDATARGRPAQRPRPVVLRQPIFPCCACSPTVAPSIAAVPSTTSTSSIWPWKTLTTRAP
ncbi:hypothetical protein R8510_04995 [Ralstonia chuxiongensis]|nr:hypothetical protein R8510_04995 [Ralstonia chuxiongensis]